ncbi:Os03g0555550, partial [Oryza sativa Japonica Group]
IRFQWNLDLNSSKFKPYILIPKLLFYLNLLKYRLTLYLPYQIFSFIPNYPLTTKEPPVRTLRLPWGHSRFTIPDVEPLVVKSGKTQTQGRSAAPGTPRLNAYNGRSFTIPSASSARLTVSSRALCDLNSSATTHSCRSNTSTP